MGLQVRKRTKGKDGWVNGSYSKRGAHASVSVKPASNITYNTGSLLGGKYKRPSRLTVDLGNGVRWVSYGSTKKSKGKNAQHAQGDSSLVIVVLVLAALFALVVIGSFIGWIGLGLVAAAIGAFFYLKRRLRESPEPELIPQAPKEQVENDGFNDAREIYKTFSEEDIEDLKDLLRSRGQSEEDIQHFIKVMNK